MSTNKMYLKIDGTKYRLPVVPETLKTTVQANNSSLNVVDKGEITIRNGRKAHQYGFSSFFPIKSFKGSISQSDMKKPTTYVNAIKKAVNEKLVVKFIFTRSADNLVDISTNCTVEKFEYEEKGEDFGTIYYSITLKEYRKISLHKVKKKKKKKSSKRSSATKSTKKTYKVKKNDTLKSIAKKKLGDSSKWKVLYKINKSVIERAAKKHGKKSSNKGHFLYAGTVLKLPNK